MKIQLCVVDNCKRHLADCDRGDECPCPPYPTAPGSRVCGHHADTTREQLRELPELWAVLGAGPAGTGSGTDDESPQPISDRARLERQGMRVMLVKWCRHLAQPAPAGRGSPLPDEQTIAANTRRDVLRHQADASGAEADADIALRRWRDPDRRYIDGDPEGRALLGEHQAAKDRAAAARQRADHAREDRQTGADIIEALREHIDRHLAWLLNTDHAADLVYDVDTVHGGAHRTAYPSRAAIRILCGCGERVPISTDHGAIIRCRGCGEWGTLSWWRAREAPTAACGPLTLRQLPDWLFAATGLVVSHKQLRNWHDRGYLTQHNYVQRPARYDPEAVAVIAHHRLNRRATA